MRLISVALVLLLCAPRAIDAFCPISQEVQTPLYVRNEANGVVDRRKAILSVVIGIPTLVVGTSPSAAAQGDYAKIEMPNVMQGMADRVNKQCLMESLGNRECLVYADPANKLYQGANNQVLLDRLEGATRALASVPALVEGTTWICVIEVKITACFSHETSAIHF